MENERDSFLDSRTLIAIIFGSRCFLDGNLIYQGNIQI